MLDLANELRQLLAWPRLKRARKSKNNVIFELIKCRLWNSYRVFITKSSGRRVGGLKGFPPPPLHKSAYKHA